jgi:hypothetical protein
MFRKHVETAKASARLGRDAAFAFGRTRPQCELRRPVPENVEICSAADGVARHPYLPTPDANRILSIAALKYFLNFTKNMAEDGRKLAEGGQPLIESR